MNETAEDGRDRELGARYRRASASDSSRPGEGVRQAILANAAALARTRAAPEAPAAASLRSVRPTRRHAPDWRWPALFGSLAVAAIAGLTVLPRLHPASAPGRMEGTSGTVEPARPPLAAIPAPAPGTLPAMPLPAAAPAAARRPAPAASASVALAAAAPVPAPAARVAAAAGIVADAADGATALRRAAQSGDLAAVRARLDAQVPVDGRDADGRTALWHAAFHGHERLVRYLLARGADPDAADRDGTTPSGAAELGAHPAIAAQLRDAAARAAP